MLIIGEKINGSRPEVAKAIAERDVVAIQTLALSQVEARSDWLDINAGTPPDQEPDDLVWLVKTVQTAVNIPLCLDSANPEALAAALKATVHTPMINSISGEASRLTQVLPLVAKYNCPVIALLLDNKGIPKTAVARLEVARKIIQATRAAGIPDDRVFLDPLTLTLASESSGGTVILDTMRVVRQEIPHAKLCVGLSNISFGLPNRSHINQVFLTLALYAGLDAAILDPLDRELRINFLAASAFLGRDKFCVKYIRSTIPRNQTGNL